MANRQHSPDFLISQSSDSEGDSDDDSEWVHDIPFGSKSYLSYISNKTSALEIFHTVDVF